MNSSSKKKFLENKRCTRCGSRKELTIDHIIPTSLLKTLHIPATNKKENLQIMCRACNELKANKVDIKNPRTIKLLRKYLGQYEDLFCTHKERRKYVFKNIEVRSLSGITYFEAVSPLVYREEKLRAIYRKQKGIAVN